MFCVFFRSLTSSSGVTSIWRKGLRRRLKRFVKCVFTGTHSTCPAHVSEFMTILFQNVKKKKKWICLTQFSLQDCVYMFALRQLLLFLKGFTESERNKLAMLTGILLANGNLSASILSSLFNENLVKEGTYLWACLIVLFVVSQLRATGRSSWTEMK